MGNRVPIEKMEEIMRKPSSKKTAEDIQYLIGLIKQIKFFKEAKNLSYLHFKEIVKGFIIKTMNKG